ncbi:unnamed protein product [Cuscuta epithymum]|uniref:Rubredoxin-like domain-containing protein n=1 Tax=Cuscuta epithymum TaxID=186058 RepID=A0AAV0GJR3_9ASTE|nr:unnamed protein product [Cuscuta epithymum]
MAALQAPPPSLVHGKRGGGGARRAPTRSWLSPPYLLLSSSSPHMTSYVAKAPKIISMRVAAASKQAYICRDCGYIYNANAKTPFQKLPDSFFCPVCGAPKRRFRAYEPAVAKNANDTAVRKARKEQLKKEGSISGALPVVIVVGVAALAGLYFYLNNNF